jgi:hypothetical protein
MDQPRILPPTENPEPGGWTPVGWHNVTDTSLWVRHRANSVELRSDEYTINTLRPDLEQTEPPGVLRVYLSAYLRWLQPTSPDDAASMLRLPTSVVMDTGIDQVRLDQDAVRALTAALRRLSSTPRPEHPRPMRDDNLIDCHDLAGRCGAIVVLADHGRVLMITATGETTALDLPQIDQLRAALRDAALDAAHHPVDTS